MGKVIDRKRNARGQGYGNFLRNHQLPVVQHRLEEHEELQVEEALQAIRELQKEEEQQQPQSTSRNR